jgi:hypothetical protein
MDFAKKKYPVDSKMNRFEKKKKQQKQIKQTVDRRKCVKLRGPSSMREKGTQYGIEPT